MSNADVMWKKGDSQRSWHLTSVLGDPAVRYRGTIGGSIANNDPAADYPAAVLALGATVKIFNKRSIAVEDFFQGMFATALEDGEIITQIAFPIPGQGRVFEKCGHPARASGVEADRRVRGQDQGRRQSCSSHGRFA